MNIEVTTNLSQDDSGENFNQKFAFEVRYKQMSDEDINDFHSFCFSIVRDVISKKFKTNEYGHINYDFKELEQSDIESTLNNISSMNQTIIREKLIFLKELNEIKNNLK